MGLKNDRWITTMAQDEGMIEPFSPELVRQKGPPHHTKVISFGLSSYGYDIRIAPEFKIFTSYGGTGQVTVVDPKAFEESAFITTQGDTCIIPPNSFVLGYSIEKIRVPDDVLVLCIGKSSYARCGLIVNTTPMEPGWTGHITLEISNTTPLPAKIYANEGIAQLLFFQGDDPCDTSYADRNGKYQNQPAQVVLPRL